jgi:hypothetical protein
MVTFECKDEKCTQSNLKIDFLGEIEIADCGGCGEILTSFDLRDDPPIETIDVSAEASK